MYSCSCASIYRKEGTRGRGGTRSRGRGIIIGVTSSENPIFAVWQR